MRRRSADFRQYHKRCTRFTQTLHKGAPFFAEPQRGGFAVCGRRERRGARRGGMTPYPRRGGFAVPTAGGDAVPTARGKKEGKPQVSLPFCPRGGCRDAAAPSGANPSRCGSAPQNKNTADPQSAVFCFIPFRQGRKRRQAARYCPRYTQSRASTPCRCRSAPSA